MSNKNVQSLCRVKSNETHRKPTKGYGKTNNPNTRQIKPKENGSIEREGGGRENTYFKQINKSNWQKVRQEEG